MWSFWECAVVMVIDHVLYITISIVWKCAWGCHSDLGCTTTVWWVRCRTGWKEDCSRVFTPCAVVQKSGFWSMCWQWRHECADNDSISHFNPTLIGFLANLVILNEMHTYHWKLVLPSVEHGNMSAKVARFTVTSTIGFDDWYLQETNKLVT